MAHKKKTPKRQIIDLKARVGDWLIITEWKGLYPTRHLERVTHITQDILHTANFRIHQMAGCDIDFSPPKATAVDATKEELKRYGKLYEIGLRQSLREGLSIDVMNQNIPVSIFQRCMREVNRYVEAHN